MQAAHSEKTARGLLGRLLLGPEPDSQRLGRRIGPPRRLPPTPAWAACRPKNGVRSWPPILIGRLSVRSAGTKPGDAGAPKTLGSFLLLPSLSTLSGGGHWAALPVPAARRRR